MQCLVKTNYSRTMIPMPDLGRFGTFASTDTPGTGGS